MSKNKIFLICTSKLQYENLHIMDSSIFNFSSPLSHFTSPPPSNHIVSQIPQTRCSYVRLFNTRNTTTKGITLVADATLLSNPHFRNLYVYTFPLTKPKPPRSANTSCQFIPPRAQMMMTALNPTKPPTSSRSLRRSTRRPDMPFIP